MSDKRHLIRRKQTWYVRKRVPKEAQHALGKELVQTTETRNLDEARRRRWAILAEMQDRIDIASSSRDPGTPSWVVNKAKEMVRSAREGGHAADAVNEVGLDWLIDELTKLRKLPLDSDGHPVIPDDSTEDAIKTAASMIHAGPYASLLSATVDTYLREHEKEWIPQTYNAKKRHLEAFLKWHKDLPVESVSRRAAGRYVEVLLSRGNAPKTVRDELSNLGAFFVWARARGYVDANPFEGMSKSIAESKRGGQRFERRAWTEDELSALLTGLDRSDDTQDRLFALAAIGAYTGMRLSEICETELSDVHEDRIHVPKGKTESAVRDVPLHKALKPLVRKLKKSAEKAGPEEDGRTYLIMGLKRGGENKRRSHYASKRFGAIKRALKVSDVVSTTGQRNRDRIDFHALRRTLNTKLRDAGVPKDQREAVVGHSPQGGVNEQNYLDPLGFEALKKALNKASYGAVDEIVKKA